MSSLDQSLGPIRTVSVGFRVAIFFSRRRTDPDQVPVPTEIISTVLAEYRQVFAPMG